MSAGGFDGPVRRSKAGLRQRLRRKIEAVVIPSSRHARAALGVDRAGIKEHNGHCDNGPPASGDAFRPSRLSLLLKLEGLRLQCRSSVGRVVMSTSDAVLLGAGGGGKRQSLYCFFTCHGRGLRNCEACWRTLLMNIGQEACKTRAWCLVSRDAGREGPCRDCAEEAARHHVTPQWPPSCRDSIRRRPCLVRTTRPRHVRAAGNVAGRHHH